MPADQSGRARGDRHDDHGLRQEAPGSDDQGRPHSARDCREVRGSGAGRRRVDAVGRTPRSGRLVGDAGPPALTAPGAHPRAERVLYP